MKSKIDSFKDEFNTEKLKLLHIGLIDGQMGIALMFFLLSRKHSDKHYEAFAEDLLDKILEKAVKCRNYSFNSGLTGIGLGIEYLVQNEYIKGDTDKILEDFDKVIFKHAANGITLNRFDLDTGSGGYALYFLYRLKGVTNVNASTYLFNKGMVFTFINEIEKLLKRIAEEWSRNGKFDILGEFAILLFFLTKLYDLKIINYKVKFIIDQIAFNLNGYTPLLHTNKLYLATLLKKINIKVESPIVEHEINNLLFSLNVEEMHYEIDSSSEGLRYGQNGLLFLLKLACDTLDKDCLQYDTINNHYHLLRKRIENRNHNPPFDYSITNGYAGILLNNADIINL